MNPAATIYGVDLCSPKVMTVINVTPDSFYAASRTFGGEEIAERAKAAVADGAAILDIGGYSSRPGAGDVPVDEEIRRVMLGIRSIRGVSDSIPISVDTFRAKVVEKALSADDKIIVNDISAGELDPQMIATVAEAGVPYIAMNMRGTPATMAGLADYDDVVSDVVDYFRAKVEQLLASGMDEKMIMLDPGFGFAKTLDRNYELLGGLNELAAAGYPIVAGVSRKSMIYKVLDVSPAESLAGTTALNWELLRQGVSVLRVHDTREAVDTIKIFNKYKSLNIK